MVKSNGHFIKPKDIGLFGGAQSIRGMNMPKIVINIPEMTLLNITSRELLLCSREDIEKLEFAIKHGTFLPENPTNGDMIKVLFPDK